MSGTGSTTDGRGRLGAMMSGLAVAVGCVLFLGGFAWAAVVYQPYTIPTDSMAPTMKPGDRVLAERIDGADVRRGDVVVFTDEVWAATPMVKRVVGIGGDKVACCDKDGRLTVNGTPSTSRTSSRIRRPPAAGGPRLAPGVLRHRAAGAGSSSSATNGPPPLTPGSTSGGQGQGSVPLSAVRGRVDAVAWPMNGMIDRPSSFAALPGGVSAAGAPAAPAGSDPGGSRPDPRRGGVRARGGAPGPPEGACRRGR